MYVVSISPIGFSTGMVVELGGAWDSEAMSPKDSKARGSRQLLRSESSPDKNESPHKQTLRNMGIWHLLMPLNVQKDMLRSAGREPFMSRHHKKATRTQLTTSSTMQHPVIFAKGIRFFTAGSSNMESQSLTKQFLGLIGVGMARPDPSKSRSPKEDPLELSPCGKTLKCTA